MYRICRALTRIIRLSNREATDLLPQDFCIGKLLDALDKLSSEQKINDALEGAKKNKQQNENMKRDVFHSRFFNSVGWLV